MIEIDESMLVRLAGARAFGRGLHIFAGGGVQNVIASGTTTNALVQDVRQHTVRLRHTHRLMEGECDCETSDGIDFCEHCVAVALHLQAQKTRAMPTTDKRSALRQIRRHLSELSHEDLLNEFLDTIKQNRALRDELLQKARLASTALSYSEIRKMIDAVGVDDVLYELRDIRAYFKSLESMLVRLREFAGQLDPLVLLRSVERAIQRFNADLERIDYADDFPESSTELLIDLHRAAMGRLTWSAQELASYLVDCGVAGQWHPFGAVAELYCDDLGISFQKAAAAEIASRRKALNKTVMAGSDQESTDELLEELAASLSAGDES